MDKVDIESLLHASKKVGFEMVDEEKTVDVSGGDDYCMLNTTEVLDASDLSGWAAVQRFRESAAAWAKLPLADAMPVVTRWDTWSPGSHLNRSGLLHLDARRRPEHRRTVLLYLKGAASTGPAAGSGFTVFPCIETDDMEAEEAARRHRICSKAQRHIQLAHERLLELRDEGLRLAPSQQLSFLSEHPELASLPKTERSTQPVEWRWTWIHDAVSKQLGGAKMDSLFELTEAMCRGEAPGLRVTPIAGSALLFESAMPQGRGHRRELRSDWRTWHAGCSPMRGHGRRYTAQMFLDDVPRSIPKQCSAEDVDCGQLSG